MQVQLTKPVIRDVQHSQPLQAGQLCKHVSGHIETSQLCKGGQVLLEIAQSIITHVKLLCILQEGSNLLLHVLHHHMHRNNTDMDLSNPDISY